MTMIRHPFRFVGGSKLCAWSLLCYLEVLQPVSQGSDSSVFDSFGSNTIFEMKKAG